jgi:hypothetical protein
MAELVNRHEREFVIPFLANEDLALLQAQNLEIVRQVLLKGAFDSVVSLQVKNKDVVDQVVDQVLFYLLVYIDDPEDVLDLLCQERTPSDTLPEGLHIAD